MNNIWNIAQIFVSTSKVSVMNVSCPLSIYTMFKTSTSYSNTPPKSVCCIWIRILSSLLSLLIMKKINNLRLKMFYQTQTALRPPKGPKDAVFCPWWPWPSNFKPSEWGTKHVFRVNLAQIRSAVPEIFHTQTKKTTDWRHQKQNLPQFTACGQTDTHTDTQTRVTTQYISHRPRLTRNVNNNYRSPSITGT